MPTLRTRLMWYLVCRALSRNVPPARNWPSRMSRIVRETISYVRRSQLRHVKYWSRSSVGPTNPRWTKRVSVLPHQGQRRSSLRDGLPPASDGLETDRLSAWERCG